MSDVVLAGSMLSMGAAEAADTDIVTMQKLNWELAEKLASEAGRVCATHGYSVAAAVVDSSGQRQAMIRGDTAPLQSLSVSYRKAYTAYAYGLAFDKNSTSELIAAKLA